MKHHSIPSTLTPENLAQWIDQNKVEQITHKQETPLSEEEIAEHEHKSALASRQILCLEVLKKEFINTLKNGTLVGLNEDSTERFVTKDFTVPPTHGLKVLESRVAYHSAMLESGVKVEETVIYLLPVPESSMIIGVDIEGVEWEQYSRMMTAEEINKFGRLFKEDNVMHPIPWEEVPIVEDTIHDVKEQEEIHPTTIGTIDDDVTNEVENQSKNAESKLFLGDQDNELTI